MALLVWLTLKETFSNSGAAVEVLKVLRLFAKAMGGTRVANAIAVPELQHRFGLCRVQGQAAGAFHDARQAYLPGPELNQRISMPFQVLVPDFLTMLLSWRRTAFRREEPVLRGLSSAGFAVQPCK